MGEHKITSSGSMAWTAEAGDSNREMMFVFHRGSQTFALPPTSVAEVLGQIEVTPVPFAPSWIEGVVGVRGDVVPVLALQAYFGLGKVEEQATRRLVVIRHEVHTLAVWADRIVGVEAVDPSALEPPLGNLPEAMLKVCKAHFRMNETVVHCLDLGLLLTESRGRVVAG
jgi:purine-binding chemotaxis protein CheW